MIIKFYGGRGSIAVTNKETCKYSGNTTCLYIETATADSIIVDAGTGIRELGLYLAKNKIASMHLIFTHYHWDHIQGFPFFLPAYLKDTVMNIYGSDNEVSVKRALSYQMNPPYFPTIRLLDLPAKFIFKELKSNFKIGSVQIQTIVNNHPNYTKGLKFIENNQSFVFLTDNELFDKKRRTPYRKFVDFVKGAKILIHDAQYTEEMYKNRLGWGHSTYDQVMKLATDSGVEQVVFTHHDPLSNDEFLENILKKYRLAYPQFNIEAAVDDRTFTLQ